MNLDSYRQSNKEQERINDIIDLVTPGNCALDVGARDGYLSIKLSHYFDSITALDLESPRINHEKIIPVKGDVTKLTFEDDSFDLVFCCEVLEHIPTYLLETACKELARVTRNHLIIGVPYKQDLRSGRSTCYSCNRINPPWGHVNSFNENKLKDLFPNLVVESISYVEANNDATNFISTFLFDYAGNPYGTYTQDESCIHCGKKLISPPERTLLQRISTKLAFSLNVIQRKYTIEQPNWIHILFKKH